MFRLSAIFVALLVLLTGCGGGDSSVGSSTRDGGDGVTDSEIIIGSHTDLSGPLALQGNTSIRGVRMRFEQANEAGGVHGRKIRFIVEDSSYQVPKAIQVANKLINRDKVFAMVAALGTPMNNAVMPRLFEKGIPNIFPLTGARSMVEPFMPLVFTAAGVYYLDTQAATRHFVRKSGASRVCVIYQDTDFGQEIFEGARDQLEALGMSLAAVSAHKPADSDFTTSVLRLRKAECELILMGAAHRDTILILEAAHKLGWDAPQWVGTEAAFVLAVAEISSGASEGFVASSSIPVFYADENNPPAVSDWLDRYLERFDEQPEYLTMAGYIFGDLVIEALERAGPDLSRASFVQALESINNYNSVFGQTYSFGPHDHTGASGTILSVVKDGRWRTMGETITY